MKKMLSLIIILCMCVCLGACNNGNSNNTVFDYMESNTNATSSNDTISQENVSIGTEGNNSDNTDESTNTESDEKNSSQSSTSSKIETNGNKISSSQQIPPQSESAKTESGASSSYSKEDNKAILTGITVKYIGKRLKTGDTLKNSDFEVIAKYSDNKQTAVTDFNINVTKLQKVGNNTLTITYKNKSCSINLNVLEGNAPNANPGGEFGYEIYDGELTITTYVGAKTDVVVPAWIDDMPVTAIEWLSEKVTSVVLPDSITRLHRKAFYNCDQLISVTLGPNIVEIGDNVFYHCQNLKAITIKKGATLIGNAMFSWCPSIEQITLPESILNIEDSAFAGCENLKILTIPASVKEIGDYQVLGYCNNIQTIYVTEGSYAQRWCLNNGYGGKLKYN